MNLKKLVNLFIFSWTSCTVILYAEKAPLGSCKPEVKKELIFGDSKRKQKARPEEIAQDAFLFLTRNFIAKFAEDSYIKKEIKQKNYTEWLDILACVYEIVTEEKNINPNYENFVLQFYSSSATMFETMKILYNKIPLSQNELTTIKDSLLRKKDLLAAISSIALRAIENSTPLSAKWKKTVTGDLSKIFPDYQSFFKSYEFGRGYKNQPMTDKEFSEFLKINKINSSSKFAVEDLVNKLEQFIYKLEQSWSLFQSSSQKATTTALIKNGKEIIDRIQTQYADLRITPATLIDKMATTKDKISIMIYSIADQLYGVYKKLLQEIGTVTPKK